MWQDYWGEQAPPVALLGGPLAPPAPPSSYSTVYVSCDYAMLQFNNLCTRSLVLPKP